SLCPDDHPCAVGPGIVEKQAGTEALDVSGRQPAGRRIEILENLGAVDTHVALGREPDQPEGDRDAHNMAFARIERGDMHGRQRRPSRRDRPRRARSTSSLSYAYSSDRLRTNGLRATGRSLPTSYFPLPISLCTSHFALRT